MMFGPSRMARFLAVDVVASTLTDPTTLLTLGASKAGTTGVKLAVKAGTTQALKKS